MARVAARMQQRDCRSRKERSIPAVQTLHQPGSPASWVWSALPLGCSPPSPPPHEMPPSQCALGSQQRPLLLWNVGVRQVRPQPLLQHFLSPGQASFAEQLSTQGHIPCGFGQLPGLPGGTEEAHRPRHFKTPPAPRLARPHPTPTEQPRRSSLWKGSWTCGEGGGLGTGWNGLNRGPAPCKPGLFLTLSPALACPGVSPSSLKLGAGLPAQGRSAGCPEGGLERPSSALTGDAAQALAKPGPCSNSSTLEPWPPSPPQSPPSGSAGQGMTCVLPGAGALLAGAQSE